MESQEGHQQASLALGRGHGTVWEGRLPRVRLRMPRVELGTLRWEQTRLQARRSGMLALRWRRPVGNWTCWWEGAQRLHAGDGDL